MLSLIRFSALVALLALAAAGCDRNTSAEREPEPRRVVATIYPLADVARTIGGSRVSVFWFIESGGSLNNPPGDDQGRLGLAELVLARNAVVDDWALAGANDPTRATDHIQLDLLAGGGEATGYSWLNPDMIKKFAAAVRQRLSEQLPAYAPYFQENERVFVQEVDSTVAEFKNRLADKSNRVAYAFPGDFAPLGEAFGIDLLPPVRRATDRLTSEELQDVRKTAAGRGIKTLFIPADRTLAVQRDLAARTGLNVFTLDPLGSSAPSGRSTYLQILRYNLEQLQEGLK